MKRDMELVRKIGFALEKHENGFAGDASLIFEGHTDDEVGYHVLLMSEAGLLIGRRDIAWGRFTQRDSIEG